jgi:hypothetical protein
LAMSVKAKLWIVHPASSPPPPPPPQSAASASSVALTSAFALGGGEGAMRRRQRRTKVLFRRNKHYYDDGAFSVWRYAWLRNISSLFTLIGSDFFSRGVLRFLRQTWWKNSSRCLTPFPCPKMRVTQGYRKSNFPALNVGLPPPGFRGWLHERFRACDLVQIASAIYSKSDMKSHTKSLV